MAFERATTVKQVDSHTYSADFQEDWCIGAGKSRCRPAFDPTYVLPLHSAHSPRSLSIALSSFVGASSGLLRPYTSYAGMLITGDSPTRWLRNFNNPSKYIRHETFPKTYLSPNLSTSLQKAVKKHFETTLSKQDQPHTLALHLDFLRRTQTGPAKFTIKDVKLGRQTSVVHITLSQDGREEVVG